MSAVLPTDQILTVTSDIDAASLVTGTTDAYVNGSVESDPYWDQIPFAHQYWRQFNIQAVPDAYHYAVAIWMTFFGIVGVLGNLLVIYIFCRTKSLRTPPNMLIVNLAISDMSFLAVNGFPLLTIASIRKIWTWGQMWCEIYGFVGGIMGFVSINSLAWIAMDRYYVISSSLTAAKKMSRRRAMIYIICIWIWSALWSVPPFLGWGRYLPEGFQTSCTFDYLTQTTSNILFVMGMFIFAFGCPVLIIIYCYVGIVRTVFKHNRELQAQASRMGATVAKADQQKKAEMQTAKVAAISVGSYLLSWTPYATVAAIGLIAPHSMMIVTPYLSEIPVMFAKASAAYNPIIYALSHPKFRLEIDKTFPWLLCCCKPPPQRSAYSTKSDGRTDSVMSKTEMDSMSSVAAVPTGKPQVAESPAANPAAGQCS